MRKTAIVQLTGEERADLNRRLEHAPLNGRQRRRDQILVVCRRRFPREGLGPALSERKRYDAADKLDGKQEVLLIALACSPVPEEQAKRAASIECPAMSANTACKDSRLL